MLCYEVISVYFIIGDGAELNQEKHEILYKENIPLLLTK